MATYNYSLKWEVNSKRNALTITACRITFGERKCEHCSVVRDFTDTLIYAKTIVYDDYIAFRDDRPKLSFAQIADLTDTSRWLIAALVFPTSIRLSSVLKLVSLNWRQDVWIERKGGERYIATLLPDFLTDDLVKLPVKAP
jgi:hypothetical protein